MLVRELAQDPAADVFHRVSYEVAEIALASKTIDTKTRMLRAAHTARSADNLEIYANELAIIATQMKAMTEHLAAVLARLKKAG